MSIADFSYLFRGRTDAYGLVHGESVKAEVTTDVYRGHLGGDTPIGIYPLVKTASGLRVAWGCTDIDDGYIKSWPLARNIQKTLRLMGIVSWIEVTKSKGFHVWVFVEGWIPAENMRNALLVAHAVAGVVPTEVNPKQLNLDGKTLGNYVNLPYPSDAQDRRVVVDDNCQPISFATFVSEATERINKPEVIATAAGLYKPPPPAPRVAIEGAVPAVDKALTDKLTGLAWTIFVGGPLERNGRMDRSQALMRLAHLMAEGGVLTPEEGVALLLDADVRWGKFVARGEDYRLEEMAARAWAR